VSKKSLSKLETDALITDNFALVVSTAKTFNPKNHTELEDYISAGSLGLVRAAYTYDSSIALFSTHAYYCIKNEIIRHIKYVKKHSHCEPLYEAVCTVTDSRYEYIKEIPTLSMVEQEILEMKQHGYSNTEIAERMEISKAKLKVVIKRIFMKVRDYAD
jgi:RNA polymerase sigma factor (sigma-70 family)